MLAVACFAGCSSDGGGPSSAPIDVSHLPDPSRVFRGEITVLGASASVPTNSRTFSGPPNAEPGKDQVDCTFAPSGRYTTSGVLMPPNLTVVAAISGRAQPQASLTLSEVRSAAPFQAQLDYDELSQSQGVYLQSRLSHESESSFYEYIYSVDGTVTPTVDSECTIEVPTFTEEHVIGQIACRNLVPTTTSRDGTTRPVARASVTIAFDCPVRVVDRQGRPIENGGGSAGNGGASGAGGSSGSSGSAGKPATAGSSGMHAGGSGGSGGSPPLTVGLGAPCSSVTDCPASQSCRYDTADYIAHMQCTASCNANSDCAQFGSDSFCIGAHICVHRCQSDADCVAKTHCNTSGWCERSGPGSGVPYCGGVATSCALLSGLSCTSASGCTDDSRCAGVSSSCYSQFDSYSCTSQDGCYWSTTSKSCSGSSRPCSYYSGQLSCALQEGCYWTGGCTGVPRACEDQFVSLCTNQPGCTVRTD